MQSQMIKFSSPVRFRPIFLFCFRWYKGHSVCKISLVSLHAVFKAYTFSRKIKKDANRAHMFPNLTYLLLISQRSQLNIYVTNFPMFPNSVLPCSFLIQCLQFSLYPIRYFIIFVFQI